MTTNRGGEAGEALLLCAIGLLAEGAASTRDDALAMASELIERDEVVGAGGWPILRWSDVSQRGRAAVDRALSWLRLELCVAGEPRPSAVLTVAVAARALKDAVPLPVEIEAAHLLVEVVAHIGLQKLCSGGD